MIEAELGSTAADEMSWFQELLSGNGRKPFRLASCPTAMPLQSAALPVPAETVMVAVADFVLSAMLVAETVYEPADDGAV